MGSSRLGPGEVARSIRQTHWELKRRLSEFDTALDALVCNSEVYADLSSAQQLEAATQWLSDSLPAHFFREEAAVFTRLAALSSEADVFVREMKQQHREIGARLRTFRTELYQLQQSEDLEQSIEALKEAGEGFTSFMIAHMAAEERQFAAARP